MGRKARRELWSSARSIETLDALVTAEDGNERHISAGGSFSVQPGNKVRVSFAALDGGAPHGVHRHVGARVDVLDDRIALGRTTDLPG